MRRRIRDASTAVKWRGHLEHGEKLGQHHRGGAPHADTADVEARHVHVAERRPRALPDFPLHVLGRRRSASGTSKSASTSCSASTNDGPRRRHADHRMQQVAADGNRQRREQPEHVHVGRDDANLFVRFAQRRRFDRFAAGRAGRPAATSGRCGGAASTPRRVSGTCHCPACGYSSSSAAAWRRPSCGTRGSVPSRKPGRHAQLGVEPRQRRGQDAPQRTREPSPHAHRTVRTGGTPPSMLCQMGQHRPAMSDLPRRRQGGRNRGNRGERRGRQPIRRRCGLALAVACAAGGSRRANGRMVAGMEASPPACGRGVTAQVTRLRASARAGALSARARAEPGCRRRSRRRRNFHLPSSLIELVAVGRPAAGSRPWCCRPTPSRSRPCSPRSRDRRGPRSTR